MTSSSACSGLNISTVSFSFISHLCFCLYCFYTGFCSFIFYLSQQLVLSFYTLILKYELFSISLIFLILIIIIVAVLIQKEHIHFVLKSTNN